MATESSHRRFRVLSALEGVNVVTSAFKPFVMPVAVVISAGLVRLAALWNRENRSRVRAGDDALVHRDCNAGVSCRSRAIRASSRPSIRGTPFGSWSTRGVPAFGCSAACFLCITGGEALYADMGHFGKGPIRCSWYGIVLPSLLLSYAGQTAFLIDKGTVTGNPFFQIAPSWSIYPPRGACNSGHYHRQPGRHHGFISP